MEVLVIVALPRDLAASALIQALRRGASVQTTNIDAVDKQLYKADAGRLRAPATMNWHTGIRP